MDVTLILEEKVVQGRCDEKDDEAELENMTRTWREGHCELAVAEMDSHGGRREERRRCIP